MTLKKKILYGLLALFLLVFIWYFNLIIYGIRQGIGQFSILWEAKSYEKFLEEGNYPDSLKVYFKEKLDLIQEVKTFAIDSLGLEDAGSYDKVYDQAGQPILWAVTACAPFELKPKEWSYGPLGRMPYKGFFDSTLAYRLVEELEEEGLDVNIYQPSAWSTLGWFSDPILSSMLYWQEGSLASLIIHEMTHATIWISGQVEYNENLADFVGDHGALLFLENKYGKNSDPYRAYTHRDVDGNKFYEHILQGANKLDSLYSGFKNENHSQKQQLKEELIQNIVDDLDTVSFENPDYYQNLFKDKLPNNAYFMSFRRYRGKQNEFEKEFEEKFDANFKAYLAYLKEKYGR